MIYISTVWRRARRLAIAVLCTSATLMAAAPLAAAHPGVPLAAFDPDEVAWASVRDRTPTEFQADFDKWIAKGHLVIDLEATVFDGRLRLGAVFQRNTDHRGSFVKTQMTDVEYKDYFDWADERNLRLVDQETYVRDGVRRHAAAWIENVENLDYSVKHSLTFVEFQQYYAEQKAAGQMPIDVDLRATPAGMRYDLAWVDNPQRLAWRLHGDLTDSEFSKTFDDYESEGFRMLVFDSAPATTGQRSAGIWLHNTNGRGWTMHRNLTAQQYANWWHRYSDEGYRQIFLGRYGTAAGDRYALIFRANSDRPAWTLRKQVNDRVQEELDDYDVPGVSVAVIQNGEFRYLRGFGHADVDAGVWLDSKHVMRTASVSKAVAGVLTMRLQELGKVAADDPAAMHIEDLPAHHTATVEQLVDNRGCVRGYNGSATDTTLAQSWYIDATVAAAKFWDDDLAENCMVGVDEVYSTFGYTILGAALEGATGESVTDLVREHITEPAGLTTMRLEEDDDLAPRRSKIYDVANEEAERDQLSWKVLGGGLEADVHDLARFGDRLLGDALITAFSRNYMWGGAVGSYSYGWSIRQDDSGDRYVEKTGGQLGADSYLQIYPDDDIVIAVLSNREEISDGQHNTEDVGEFIGNLMTP